MSLTDRSWLIGVDTGGTFTDSVIATPDQLYIGKALTTPGALWKGIVESIDDASQRLGGLETVLARTSTLAHGTTAMLNAILTKSGATVGIVTTAGFEDTLAIGRVHQKVAGLSEWEMTDVYRLRKSTLFADKQLIKGICERIDRDGRVLEAMDEKEVVAAARLLHSRGATSFAVNFLWSCVNPEHEQRAAAAIRRALPGCSVSCSSDLAVVVGEYERFATAAVNAYIVDIAAGYLEKLSSELGDRGFRGRLLVMRSWGDLERVERVAERAVPSLFSGPIGGVMGAQAVAARAKPATTTLLCADVGGTSFDVALVDGARARWRRNPIVERLHLALPTIDVASIAIGGGSIATRDKELGLLHVGPKSAGAAPGPACYGRGGNLPTVTDAALVAGWIRPDAAMPGGIRLSPDLAQRALVTMLGEDADDDASDLALSVLQIACAHMADLVRKSCIEAGVDPRICTPLFYGGAGGQYAAAICEEIGARAFLAPECASAFSAFGMLSSREGFVLSKPVNMVMPVDKDALAQVLKEMEEAIGEDLAAASGVTFDRHLEMKYKQQINEIRVDVSPQGVVRQDLAHDFVEAYERRFGRGTSNASSIVEVTAASVHGSCRLTDIEPTALSAASAARTGDAKCTGHHSFIWLDRKAHSSAIYSFADVRSAPRSGPAIISDSYTSVVVPDGWLARWRADVNMLEVSAA